MTWKKEEKKYKQQAKGVHLLTSGTLISQNPMIIKDDHVETYYYVKSGTGNIAVFGSQVLLSYIKPTKQYKKWGLYIQTEYLEDKPISNIKMDFTDLFTISISEVIKYTKEQFISPNIFIDIHLFDIDGNRLESKIDWDTLMVEVVEEKKYQKIIIGIYVDNNYLNETIVTMNNSANVRINKSETQ